MKLSITMLRFASSAALFLALASAGIPVAAAAATPPPDRRVEQILPGSGENAPLPAKHFKFEIIPSITKLFLALTGTLSVGVFVYAGIMLVIAHGNEEEITKFKNALIWSSIAIALIGASYALVTGVLKLGFE